MFNRPTVEHQRFLQTAYRLKGQILASLSWPFHETITLTINDTSWRRWISSCILLKIFSVLTTTRIFHHKQEKQLFSHPELLLKSGVPMVHVHLVLWMMYDDIIKWKHFPCYWLFVRGVHLSPGEIPVKRPVTLSFDVYVDLHLTKQLSKQSRGWWFETPSRSLWRHFNEVSYEVLPFSLSQGQYFHKIVYY